jgi:RHS repeat-associated protein
MISLWVRLYDPAIGRFTQPNSLGYAGGGTLYAYAGNNLATYYVNLRFYATYGS